MSMFQKIPAFKIPYNGETVEVHPIDLKYISQSMIVAPDFLTAIAKYDKPLVRHTAADHVNTPPETLVEMLYDESPIVYFAALENHQTPFEAVLCRWSKIMPEGTVWDSPAIVERHDDLREFLKKHNITEEESRKLPALWIVKTLETIKQ